MVTNATMQLVEFIKYEMTLCKAPWLFPQENLIDKILEQNLTQEEIQPYMTLFTCPSTPPLVEDTQNFSQYSEVVTIYIIIINFPFNLWPMTRFPMALLSDNAIWNE